MKNNKLIIAVLSGVIAGSVGTSIVGNFETSKVNNSSIASSSKNFGDRDYSNDGREIPPDFEGGNFEGRGGKRGGHHQGEADLDSTESVDVTSGEYKDGTYDGTASGYASNLKVQVKIESGKISNVEIVSHNETPGFYEKAFEKVPAEIVEKQSTNVDTASGATYSSVGIINAVNNALSSAKA